MLSGDDYKDIKKTIGIYILDYELENLKEIENAHTKWQIVEVESKIARKMKKENLPIELIIKITELTKEEIEKL